MDKCFVPLPFCDIAFPEVATHLAVVLSRVGPLQCSLAAQPGHQDSPQFLLIQTFCNRV